MLNGSIIFGVILICLIVLVLYKGIGEFMYDIQTLVEKVKDKCNKVKEKK